MIDLMKSIPNAELLNNKTVLVTGATGLIGSRLVEVLLEMNEKNKVNISIIASGRSLERLEKRFFSQLTDKLSFWEIDLDNEELTWSQQTKPNFIIHAASAANPKYYKENPVETMTGNFLGALKLLNLFSNDFLENFLFISSGEVYGDFSEDIREITEDMQGYIDNLDPRSCYPVSKRATETLCASYSVQYNQKVTIARPSHIFGPGFNKYDTRISAEFFRLAFCNQDIIMKSPGIQKRSYTYIDDCVSGILCVLLNGNSGEAYNVTKQDNEIELRDFAQKIADRGKVELIFDYDESEIQKTMEFASFSNQKLKTLGWIPEYTIDDGIEKMFADWNNK